MPRREGAVGPNGSPLYLGGSAPPGRPLPEMYSSNRYLELLKVEERVPCRPGKAPHLISDLDDGSPAPLKSLNTGSQLCFKVRIPDQITIKSTLDRQNIYLVNV